jgi:hypothetical protein
MHKKNTIEKSLNWDAHYVGIKATRERQQNYITLEELVDEVMPLLYRFAPITIEDQIPVFTEWVANALKENMGLPRSRYFRPRLK